MKNEDDLYTTRDLYLAATLMTLGFKLSGVDFQVEGARSNPVGYFNFENSEDLRDAEQKFWRGTIAIDPRIFITNMKGLKSQVNSVYKAPTSKYNK